MHLAIIGKGNVATNLEQAFLRNGFAPVMVSSRTLDGLPPEADVYIYAVRDSALAEVAQRVRVHQRALHVHTSGTMPIDVFGPDKPHAGILYPFMTFSKEKLLDDFRLVPLFIEGRDIDDTAAIYSLAQSISSRVYEASAAERQRLHVAGVLVNNFPNALFAMAADLLQSTSIPFRVLLPLIDETAAKVHTLSPREAQTGPAKRGDAEVMARHESILSNQLDKDIYRALSQLIQRQQG